MRKRWLSALHQLARKNERIVFIGSDLTADAAMKELHKDIGNRFFMEGISEQHLIGMASGLAMSGLIPYVNTIATFLTRRCFEQNAVDLGLANANVRLIGGGGGLVYCPLGPTHLAIDDIALMRAIPNFTVIVPADADEMERAIIASERHQGPIYLRVAKGGDPVVSKAEHGFTIGKAIVHREPGEALIIATGILVNTALKAADQLAASGIPTGVINVHTVKPLDQEGLLARIGRARAVVTLEEHLLHGGLGSAVAELVAEHPQPRPVRFRRLGLPDAFPDQYGSQDSLLKGYGLGAEGVAASVQKLLSGSS
jgi:transketolase